MNTYICLICSLKIEIQLDYYKHFKKKKKYNLINDDNNNLNSIPVIDEKTKPNKCSFCNNEIFSSDNFDIIKKIIEKKELNPILDRKCFMIECEKLNKKLNKKFIGNNNVLEEIFQESEPIIIHDSITKESILSKKLLNFRNDKYEDYEMDYVSEDKKKKLLNLIKSSIKIKNISQ